jgi:hypothetical protein
MLLALPKAQKRVFIYKSLGFVGKIFRQTRLRGIQKLGNSELGKIDFYTCRYWRVMVKYRRVGDFGAVMYSLVISY